jgi:hypothetical protein
VRNQFGGLSDSRSTLRVESVPALNNPGYR